MSEQQRDNQTAAATFPVYLGYAALVLLFFAPHLLGLASFSANDFTQLFLPFSMFQLDALLELRLPVWDPHTNSGHPYLADPQAAVFYPVSNALLLLTGFVRGAAGRLYLLHVEAALHVFLACCFTYAFVRRLTGQRLAAFAAGLIFGFSGYLTGYPPLQLSILRTAVWLPLILLLLLPKESRAPDWKSWLAAAAVHAIAFYAGHPQTFLFMTYTVGGWILMLGFAEWAHAGIRRRRLRPGTLGPIIALTSLARFTGRSLLYGVSLIALSLMQLWPTWEFTKHSVRSFVPSDYLTGGFEWEDSWQFLFPGVLTEFSPQYIGIIGLGLALAAVIALFSPALYIALDRNLGRAPVIFFVICGVAAILLSYGSKGPLYALFFRFAPGGDLFRGQERAIYVAVFSLSVLAGYGLAVLPSLADRLRRLLGWGLFGAVLAGAAVFLVFWLLPHRADIAVSKFFLIGALALLFAAAFALLCGTKRVTRTVLLLFLPLLFSDLLLANFSTNLSDGPGVRASLDRREATAALDAAFELAQDGSGPRPRVYNEFRLPDSSGLFVGWEDVWGSSPMRLFYYDSLFHDFPLHRLWELTGVGTVLTWREELPVASRLLEEFPGEGETDRIHALEVVSPRWWWAQKARRNVADRDAPGLLADPNFDPKSDILVAESDADLLGNSWNGDRLSFGSGGSASLRAEQIGPAHMRFEVESDQKGLLFVSENWLPGWQALWTDDGGPVSSEELTVVRAQQAFLGIPVPAGKGTLELRYRPDSIRWGLAISGVAWAALLFALRASIWNWMLLLGPGIARPIGRGVIRAASTIFGERRIRQFSTTPTAGVRNVFFGNRQDFKWLWPVILILVTMLGFALRLFRLGYQELSPAEMVTYNLNTVSWAESTDLALDVFVTLVIQRIWHMLAGSSEFALRSVNAFAGTIVIALVYVFARQLRLSRSVALMSSFFLAVSALAVWHGQVAEAGMLSLVLSTASMILALTFVRNGGSLRAGAALVVCTAAALYTNPFAVMILLVQNLHVILLFAREVRSRQIGLAPLLPGSFALRWLLAQGAVVVLTFPWIIWPWLTLWFDFGHSNSYSLAVALLRWLGILFLGNSVPHSIWQVDAGILAFAVIIAGILATFFGRRAALKPTPDSKLRETDEKAPPDEAAQGAAATTGSRCEQVLLFLYLVVPMAGVWALGSGGAIPIIDVQLTVAALIPFAIAVSVGVAAIGREVEGRLGWRWRIWTANPSSDGPTTLMKVSMGHVAAVVLICLYMAGNLFSLSNHYFDSSFTKSRGLRQLGSRIEQWGRGLTPAEVQTALSINADNAIPYYHPESVGHTFVAFGSGWAHGAAHVETLAERGYGRVLLPVPAGGFSDLNERTLEEFSQYYNLVASASLDNWALHLYSRPDPDQWQSLAIPFVNELTLTRVQVEPEVPPAGGILVVHMEWSGVLERLTGGEKVFLHLLDEGGNLIAQRDPELRMDHSPHTISTAIEVPAALPTGSLRLIAGLYDVTVEGAPRILTESGEDSLTLVSFPVQE